MAICHLEGGTCEGLASDESISGERLHDDVAVTKVESLHNHYSDTKPDGTLKIDD